MPDVIVQSKKQGFYFVQRLFVTISQLSMRFLVLVLSGIPVIYYSQCLDATLSAFASQCPKHVHTLDTHP